MKRKSTLNVVNFIAIHFIKDNYIFWILVNTYSNKHSTQIYRQISHNQSLFKLKLFDYSSIEIVFQMSEIIILHANFIIALKPEI